MGATSAGGAAASRLGQISLHIDPAQPGKFSVEWGVGGAATSGGARAVQASAAPAAPAAAKADEAKGFNVPETEISLEEVAKHNKKDDLWVAVKGIVMDLTSWVNDHPGLSSFAAYDAG